MRTLDRKLLRDLWNLRGQALAICLVIAGGVATFVMFASTLDSLQLSRDAFFRDYHFADVFASLKRAPRSLASRIEAIPGLDQVETRVVAPARLEVTGFSEPVSGLIVSLPDERPPILNQLYLSEGRRPAPDDAAEVVVSKPFAQAHGLSPGDALYAIIKGHRERLNVVGIGLSPEYVFSPEDPKRQGVLWMRRTLLASAYDMEGAFNNIVLTLTPRARTDEIIERLDELLRPYGGLGAYGREEQPSYEALTNEIHGLKVMGTILPVVFLGVASFLLNVVISRLVSTQREQIAALKAFGYSNLAVGIHYLKLIGLIVVIGVCAGLPISIWLAGALSELYAETFHFPAWARTLPLESTAIAAVIVITAAILGAVHGIYQAARLPPAQAMRPEPPRVYREALIERWGLKRLMAQPTRMIVRHIERTPVKSLLTIMGIGLACGTMLLTSFVGDSIYYAVDTHFKLAQRQDLSIIFTEPTSSRALFELRSLPGIEYAEGFRSVGVRFRFRHRSDRTTLNGILSDGELYRLLNRQREVVELPPEGLVLTDYLAQQLGVQPGDRITVEVLEGSRLVKQVPVAGLVSEFVGLSGYMQLQALQQFLGEGDVLSGARLSIDPHYRLEIMQALKAMPQVAQILDLKAEIDNFYEQRARVMLFTNFVAGLLAASIAFGVVYNSARIVLTERSRELASLRVLGFTRREIAYILLGELGLLTLIAIPPGWLFGYGLCSFLAWSMWDESMRLPVVVQSGTYALATTVILVTAMLSALLVRRKLDRLDLVEVLKTRE